MTYSEQYKDCLEYIDKYWDKIILKPKLFRVNNKALRRVIMRAAPKNFHIIEVPYTALVPNSTKFRYIFYWDSYFMFRGLIGTKNEWVIPEMVENFIYIFKKYGIIPNFSHPESLGRSQAPFLTTMILDAYDVIQKDRRISSRLSRIIVSKKLWLKRRMDVAKLEYNNVWESPVGSVGGDGKGYNHKVIEYNLNRYGDRDAGYGLHAEQESGWDMTSRFYTRCDQFLPIDLNSYLYKYEIDFAKSAEILGNAYEKKFWEEKAEKRKILINKFMWNEKTKFFYDYDYVQNQQSEFLSLAGFVPLWAGLATEAQARKMLEKLPAFKTKYGLAITDKDSLPPAIDLANASEPYRVTLQGVLKHKQWDYPNIWPPAHYQVTIGLLRYGFINEAKNLMDEYLQSNAYAFGNHGKMLEKMDGQTGDMPPTYWYPTQLGFGWTNAIFYRYISILDVLKDDKSIYVQPQPHTPPYNLSIIH